MNQRGVRKKTKTLSQIHMKLYPLELTRQPPSTCDLRAFKYTPFFEVNVSLERNAKRRGEGIVIAQVFLIRRRCVADGG
jgi:hypothetical protein